MKTPTTWHLACASLFTLMATVGLAQAQTVMTPQAQFLADTKAAQAQYESDKRMCDAETISRVRLQCRRDAKMEYDHALAQAETAVKTSNRESVTPAAAVVCANCGKVVSVAQMEKPGKGGAAGIIGGGAAGAILGNQVGSGTGKDIATIAGAVGGAYAGKKIEERVKTHTVWNVGVEYEDGSRGNVEFDRDPGFKVGDSVKWSGDTLINE